MKRKQLMVLLLCGVMTFGTVSPVLAADVPVSEPAATETIQGGEDASVNVSEEVTAPEVTDEAVPGITPDNNAVAEESGEASNVLTKDAATAAPGAKETAAPAGTEAPAAEPAAPEGETEENAETQQVQDFVSDEMLQSMSANLTLLAQQLLDNYNAMTAEEKAAILTVTDSEFDAASLEQEIAYLKSIATFEALKGYISEAESAEEADIILTYFEENIFVHEVDELNFIIQSAKSFASDYNQYLKDGLATLTKQLQTIVARDYMLFTDDFVAQAQAYLDEIVTIEPGVQSNKDVVAFHSKVSNFLATSGKHLNKAILEDGIRAGEAFQAFVDCAPDPSIVQTTFNYGNGYTLTYAQVAAEVWLGAQELLDLYNKGELTYNELSSYYDNYYANLGNAYEGVSAEILKFVSAEVADAAYIGYTGAEKNAYEAALQAYNKTFASADYKALPAAVEKLGQAASAYTQAAENYSKEEGRKQIPELKNKLGAVKADIDAHKAYYNDKYSAEVDAMFQQLSSADVNQMTGRQIVDLLNGAKAVIAKQSSSYSQKMTDTIANAQSLIAKANEWWAFLPDNMKGNAPYAEAISLTNQLAEAIASNGIYDLDKLIKAYDAFTSEYNAADGKIQVAAKAVAQYVLDQAEAVYAKESKNKHTDGLLKTFRDAIDNLKSSIAAWDFDGTRAVAAAVKTAETNVLNDKPAQEVEKAKTEKATVKTGDMSEDASASGLLALLSMTTIAGVLGLKRRR